MFSRRRQALSYINSLGLVHCDVKPENVLLSHYGRAEVKLIDFGSSCFVTDRLTTYTQSRCVRRLARLELLLFSPLLSVQFCLVLSPAIPPFFFALFTSHVTTSVVDKCRVRFFFFFFSFAVVVVRIGRCSWLLCVCLLGGLCHTAVPPPFFFFARVFLLQVLSRS